MAVVYAPERARLTSDPEFATGIHQQRGDAVTREVHAVLFAEEDKSRSIESGQPFESPNPQVTIGGLSQRRDVSVRQTVFGMPGCNEESRWLGCDHLVCLRGREG
jgi:hypothetical protein